MTFLQLFGNNSNWKEPLFGQRRAAGSSARSASATVTDVCQHECACAKATLLTTHPIFKEALDKPAWTKRTPRRKARWGHLFRTGSGNLAIRERCAWRPTDPHHAGREGCCQTHSAGVGRVGRPHAQVGSGLHQRRQLASLPAAVVAPFAGTFFQKHESGPFKERPRAPGTLALFLGRPAHRLLHEFAGKRAAATWRSGVVLRQKWLSSRIARTVPSLLSTA